MKPFANSAVIIILAALSISACTTVKETKRYPYNDADTQKTRAHQAQDELSAETLR